VAIAGLKAESLDDASRAGAATVTFPDMRIQVPTNLISIGTDPRNLHSSEFRYMPSNRPCQASIVCVSVDE
jgi:hypothetical protein